MFSQFKLSGKIVGTIVVVLACHLRAQLLDHPAPHQSAGRGSLPRQSPPDRRHDEHHAGVVSDNLNTLYGERRTLQDLNQVPAVAAWSVAKRYAQDNELTFHMPVSQSAQSQQPARRFRASCPGEVSAGSLAEGVFRAGQRGRQGSDALRAADPPHPGLSGLPRRCPRAERDPFGYAKEGMKNRRSVWRLFGYRPHRAVDKDGELEFDCDLSAELFHPVGLRCSCVPGGAEVGGATAVEFG